MSPWKNKEDAKHYMKNKRAEDKQKLLDKLYKFSKYWSKYGPVKFAIEFLKIKLSNDQIEFLNYLWKGENPFVSLVAPRNSGKTYCLGIYVTWLLVTQQDVNISCMGGSLKQSSRLMRYISSWRKQHSELYHIIDRFKRSPMERVAASIFDVRIEFLSCTKFSAKGEHGYVILDEVSTAESTREGLFAVESILGQLLEHDTKLILTSTCDNISGMFYKICGKPEEFGFKHFEWSIVDHVSKEDPRLHYDDKDPKSWIVKKDCSWISQDKINKLLKLKDSNWFLVNILGGLTKGSGNVFSRKDMNMCIINFGLTLPFTDLRIGVDLGFSATRDPSAIVVLGFYQNRVFALESEEVNIPRITEVVDWIIEKCKKWNVYECWIDPTASSKGVISLLETQGYVCPRVAEIESTKDARVGNVINLVEKHQIILHKENCASLIKSLKALCWDDNRKIRKVNDHGFDSLQYSCVGLPIEIGIITTSLELKQEQKQFLNDWFTSQDKLAREWGYKTDKRVRLLKKGENPFLEPDDEPKRKHHPDYLREKRQRKRDNGVVKE